MDKSSFYDGMERINAHRIPLAQIRSEAVFKEEHWYRIGPLWVARLQIAEPQIVHLVVADRIKTTAFRKLVAILREEERRAGAPLKLYSQGEVLLTVLRKEGGFDKYSLDEIVIQAEEYYRERRMIGRVVKLDDCGENLHLCLRRAKEN